MFKKILAFLLFLLLCLGGCAPTVTEPPVAPPATPPSPEEPPADSGGEELPDESWANRPLSDELRSLLDFVVEVDPARDPVVLHLTDTQIIDTTQVREGDSDFGTATKEFWGPDKMEDRCFGYIRETVEETKPDLILLTGDLVYGKYDDAGTSLTALITFMESLGVPWAPVYGNHDAESAKGADWQCDQLEAAEHCLFLQRTLTGNGNYTVGIAQGERLVRVFFMMDSNGGGPSAASLANGHTKKSVGFGQDQIEWYTETAYALYNASPTTRLSFAFHIQTAAFAEAYAKYGFTNTETENNPLYVDFLDERQNGDFGYLRADLKSQWDADGSVMQGILDLGADSFFVGHEHCNNASVVYDGVRYQFGQKSSTYDRYVSVMPDNTITTGTRTATEAPLVGGTVVPLTRGTGEIKTPYIYYCKKDGVPLDWDAIRETYFATKPKVGGLGLDSGLSHESKLTVQAVNKEGVGVAYCVTAYGQGKLYIDVSLLKGAKTLTFSVLLPSTSKAQLSGHGEFSLRIKPNEAEPPADGRANGYIDYATDSTSQARKLRYSTWQTFTVDIANLGDVCTELALLIAEGNVLYIKDIVIS